MAEKDSTFNFDWLPGFKEMMACQEPSEEERPENISGSMSEEVPENISGGMNMPDTQEMLPPERLQQEEQTYWKDYEYMLRILPSVAREIWAVADAILDRYEFEGSSMYAEYPDKTAIYKIVDLIYEKLKYYESNPVQNQADGTETRNPYYIPEEERGINSPLRDIIFIMTLWNMAYRRQRYYRRKRVFP